MLRIWYRYVSKAEFTLLFY